MGYTCRNAYVAVKASKAPRKRSKIPAEAEADVSNAGFKTKKQYLHMIYEV